MYREALWQARSSVIAFCDHPSPEIKSVIAYLQIWTRTYRTIGFSEVPFEEVLRLGDTSTGADLVRLFLRIPNEETNSQTQIDRLYQGWFADNPTHEQLMHRIFGYLVEVLPREDYLRMYGPRLKDDRANRPRLVTSA
jgi:hypothetical protein